MSADVSCFQLLRFNKMRWFFLWSKLCFLPLPAWPRGFQLMWFTNSWVRLEKMANHATSSTFLGAAERPPFWVSAAKIWGQTVSWFISCSRSIFPISWHLSADMHQKWCDILWSKFVNVSLMFWATWSQNFIQFCLAVFEIGRGEPWKWSTLYKTLELSKSAEGNGEYLWSSVAFVKAWIKCNFPNGTTA